MLPIFLKGTDPSSQHTPKGSYSKTANTISLKKSSVLWKTLWRGGRRGNEDEEEEEEKKKEEEKEK